MRSDFNSPSTHLRRATQKVQDQWLDTKQQWDDRVSARFQDRYLDPLVPQLQLVASAIHELVEVLNQAVAETDDDQGPEAR